MHQVPWPANGAILAINGVSKQHVTPFKGLFTLFGTLTLTASGLKLSLSFDTLKGVYMGATIRIDPRDPRKLFYLDSHDYRRRPRAMVPGCSLITIYLRRELKAAGEPIGDMKEQLTLAVRRWRIVDRIRAKSANARGNDGLGI